LTCSEWLTLFEEASGAVLPALDKFSLEDFAHGINEVRFAAQRIGGADGKRKKA
jgi:hypothetical protein